MTEQAVASCRHLADDDGGKMHFLRIANRVIIMCPACWQMVCDNADLQTVDTLMKYKKPGQGT